ncbi:uncharacterized protein JCM15063_003008 [Sporobolomyces koalae]|uniref:uncharacterized protein n=1 Tax=Sporobolomyces koalae TaxID=500713 RepID=UPI0031765DAE
MDDHQAALIRELDGYLTFLKRRQEIELDSAESLRRLAHRSTSAEPESELHAHIPTSWRQSWIEVRGSLEDEAQSHRMAAEGLDKLVQKLTHFRDDRDRIRRRIREDLRTTATEYSDYKTVVGRLRKAYERKVEELFHHEEAEHAKDDSGTKSPVANSEAGGWPPEHWAPSSDSVHFPLVKSRDRSDSSASSGKGVPDTTLDLDAGQASQHISFGSPPQASVFVSGATSSSGSAPSAYRDPPTAKQNVFEAIAKRDWSTEKHRVNSIVRAVGSLAKGNDSGVSLNSSKGARSRQYGGKLKREAEEADRQYRAGIFQLETLRLQKQRVQASARESLREFVTEMALIIKEVLDQRVSDQLSMGYAQVAIGDHVKPAVGKIEPYRDVENYFIAVPDEPPADQPVYYINAFIGECRSLLFGVSLQDYCANHPGLLVPTIVQRCIEKVESSGLDFEGIYRVPGKLATIQQIVHRMEKGEESFRFGDHDEVSAVAGVLKLYLRQLPIALFPFPASDRKAFAADYASSPEKAMAALLRRIRRLSAPQQATLKAVCRHLARVAQYVAVNKMTPSNLGLIFSAVVFGEDEGATLESLQNSKDSTMELLIKQQDTLFEGLPLEQPALVRSKQPSSNIGSTVRPASVQPEEPVAASSSSSLVSASETPPSANPATGRANSRQSVDSIYALYQNASSGLHVNEQTQPQQHMSSPSLPPAPGRSSAIPIYPSAPRVHPHPTSSPLRPSTTASQPVFNIPHVDSSSELSDLDSPSPPLSAALGRHVPQSNSHPNML